MGVHYHYHVDEFRVDESGKVYWERESRAIFSKPAAERAFFRRVEELRRQVGKFVITKVAPEFPGAIRVARNRKIAVALTRCDCGE